MSEERSYANSQSMPDAAGMSQVRQTHELTDLVQILC